MKIRGGSGAAFNRTDDDFPGLRGDLSGGEHHAEIGRANETTAWIYEITRVNETIARVKHDIAKVGSQIASVNQEIGAASKGEEASSKEGEAAFKEGEAASKGEDAISRRGEAASREGEAASRNIRRQESSVWKSCTENRHRRYRKHEM